MKTRFNQALVDNTGACLSFACAVHCLAMPFWIVVLPLVGLGFLATESAEKTIITVAAALAVGSLAWGVRHHRSWRAFLILVVALAFIIIGRTTIEGTFEVVFHSVGGILLASAHLVNRHLCNTCPQCEEEGVGRQTSS